MDLVLLLSYLLSPILAGVGLAIYSKGEFPGWGIGLIAWFFVLVSRLVFTDWSVELETLLLSKKSIFAVFVVVIIWALISIMISLPYKLTKKLIR